MPKPGYKSVTIPDALYEEFMRRSRKNHQSMAEYLEHLASCVVEEA